MLRDGYSFEEVEQFIEAQMISPEHKVALRFPSLARY
jgi:hypothetical protein